MSSIHPGLVDKATDIVGWSPAPPENAVWGATGTRWVRADDDRSRASTASGERTLVPNAVLVPAELLASMVDLGGSATGCVRLARHEAV